MKHVVGYMVTGALEENKAKSRISVFLVGRHGMQFTWKRRPFRKDLKGVREARLCHVNNEITSYYKRI